MPTDQEILRDTLYTIKWTRFLVHELLEALDAQAAVCQATEQAIEESATSWTLVRSLAEDGHRGFGLMAHAIGRLAAMLPPGHPLTRPAEQHRALLLTLRDADARGQLPR